MTFADAYLTIDQVAAELGFKSKSGVYKLIQRNQLPVVRLSARNSRVARWALDAYKERHGIGDPPGVAVDSLDLTTARKTFRRQTGRSPEQWVEAWKAGTIADSAENMGLLVRAVSLRDSTDKRPAAKGARRTAKRRRAVPA
ncbi:MAG TPA: helix-turn-helix domain-containing protein [Solirubrobacteraceae bacterium]|jgi:excisionase family DNA binding protein